MTVLVALAAVVAATGCAAAWLLPDLRSRELGALALLVGAAALGPAAAVPGPLSDSEGTLGYLLAVVLAPVAVLGGGPVTAVVLRLADRGAAAGQVAQAATVLRGGAWIGVFERTGIFAALVAGWPEGIAVVLGLKGLGRYSEIRSDSVREDGPGRATGAGGGGVAERFIIGTFCSVLWAAGCAGTLLGLVG